MNELFDLNHTMCGSVPTTVTAHRQGRDNGQRESDQVVRIAKALASYL